MQRRAFLQAGLKGISGAGLAGIAGYGGWTLGPSRAMPLQQRSQPLPLIRSITPVVGDGRWIWDQPPEETGYLEPREYELEVGIHLKGTGSAQMLQATTPVPVELPEQTIESVDIAAVGCRAIVRSVSNEAAQLKLAAPSIVRGQVVSAVCKMQLTLFKQYHGFDKEHFPSQQPEPALAFKRQYLFDSPGIQTRAPEVRKLRRELTADVTHPWDAAHKIYQWVWKNIHAKMGDYTSVVRALRSRVGDCEERAACFVALCRASGIPARLVWIPNHNWAEFYLVDESGQGRWIPAHTAAYSWFGWTGVHELVIQKGDNLWVPEKRQPQRLLADWSQWKGSRPETRFSASIRPLANSTGDDAGPGARSKDRFGRWSLDGTHDQDRYLRDGNLQVVHVR